MFSSRSSARTRSRSSRMRAMRLRRASRPTSSGVRPCPHLLGFGCGHRRQSRHRLLRLQQSGDETALHGQLSARGRLSAAGAGGHAAADHPEMEGQPYQPLRLLARQACGPRSGFRRGAVERMGRPAHSGRLSALRAVGLVPIRSVLGKQPGYAQFDFTAGMESDAWSAEVFVENAFDDCAQNTATPNA